MDVRDYPTGTRPAGRSDHQWAACGVSGTRCGVSGTRSRNGLSLTAHMLRGTRFGQETRQALTGCGKRCVMALSWNEGETMDRMLVVASLVACELLAPCVALADTGVPTAKAQHELILCGWDEVFILDLSGGTESQPNKVWSWRAKDRPELPSHMRDRFGTTDDCKPVDGGRRLLITSSGGGAALVDRETGRASFWATVGNAHSADMLPKDRVAVAGSYIENELGGNVLEVFDARVPEKPVYTCELTGGHGLVWDGKRRTLWALTGEDVRAYQLLDWDSAKPSLKLLGRYDLPEPGGHDMFPLPGDRDLSVTTMGHCWLFNRDTHSFKLHPFLSDTADVKSICVNPSTGQLVYIQGGLQDWWSDTIHLLTPRRTICLPDERLYKARWNVVSDRGRSAD
jgi:hypothetical protein